MTNEIAVGLNDRLGVPKRTVIIYERGKVVEAHYYYETAEHLPTAERHMEYRDKRQPVRGPAGTE